GQHDVVEFGSASSAQYYSADSTHGPRPNQDEAVLDNWIMPAEKANHAALAGMWRLKSAKLWQSRPQQPVLAPPTIHSRPSMDQSHDPENRVLKKNSKAARISTVPTTPVSASASA